MQHLPRPMPGEFLTTTNEILTLGTHAETRNPGACPSNPGYR
ncbi:MAG: hypothetical protein WCC57_19355 [Paracoccaceae bacterium]